MLGHGRSLENHNITQIYAIMITQIPNCTNGAHTLKIHHDEAVPGLDAPMGSRGLLLNTTHTTLKVMQKV